MRAVAIALVLALSGTASAHSLAFGVLRVRHVPGGVALRLDASGSEGNAPDLSLAVEGCALVAPIARRIEASRLHLDAELRCADVAAARVSVLGLAASEVTLAVRRDGDASLLFLEGTDDAFVIGEPPRATEVLSRYARLGVEHIATGLDHLAFVLLLFLAVLDPRAGDPRAGSRRTRALVLAVSGFTLGHSITLSLAALGLARLDSAPVEACIALSIVVLAAELLRDGEGSLTLRRPWIVASVFGLLHGLGFAGALREVGLPEGHVPSALVGFNVGVELGQLLFVSLLLGVAALSRRWLRSSLRADAVRALTWTIGIAATLWTVERLTSLGA